MPIKGERYCNWVLLAPHNHVISISWLLFNLEESYECIYDYVEVFDNNTIKEYGGSLGKYCGTKAPPALTSSSNVVTIRYYMDESINLDGFIFSYVFLSENKGMKFESQITSNQNSILVCGGSFFSNVGVIKSPNYPAPYALNQECVWIIKVRNGQQVELNVKEFDIEDSPNCAYDFLEIR